MQEPEQHCNTANPKILLNLPCVIFCISHLAAWCLPASKFSYRSMMKYPSIELRWRASSFSWWRELPYKTERSCPLDSTTLKTFEAYLDNSTRFSEDPHLLSVYRTSRWTIGRNSRPVANSIVGPFLNLRLSLLGEKLLNSDFSPLVKKKKQDTLPGEFMLLCAMRLLSKRLLVNN